MQNTTTKISISYRYCPDKVKILYRQSQDTVQTKLRYCSYKMRNTPLDVPLAATPKNLVW